METTPTNAALTRLAIDHRDGIIHITFPSGEVDGTAIRELYEQVAALTNTPNQKILVDFTAVAMVGSAAMGMLVTIKKKCLQANAQLHIVIPSEYVYQAFEAMQLTLILAVFRSTEEALNRFH